MHGYFENNSLYLDIEISGVITANKRTIKVQVDTGFNGHLTVSFADAFPLGLVLVGTTAYTLADGSTVNNFVCLGTVTIDGKDLTIPIDIQPSGMTLMGTQLLQKLSCVLNVDFTNKTVEIIKNEEPPKVAEVEVLNLPKEPIKKTKSTK